jgi:tRNA (guanine37-N1)-methyltransferase
MKDSIHKSIWTVEVDSTEVDYYLRKLKDENLFDDNFKIKRLNSKVYLPIKEYQEVYSPIKKDLIFHPRRKLKGSLSEKIKEKIPSLKINFETYDLIGSILVLPENSVYGKLDEFYLNNLKLIVREHYPQITAVARVISRFDGQYRMRKHELIIGNTLKTIHKENGLKFHLNLNEVYFSPRMANERLLISKNIRSNETDLLVLFAGVGPIALSIAKKNPSCNIIAVENNIKSVEYFNKNIEENKISNIEIVHKDVLQYLDELIVSNKKFDLITISTPKYKEQDYSFLKPIIQLLKKETRIILYMYSGFNDRFNDPIDLIKSILVDIELISTRICGSIGKNHYRMAIEFKV